MNRTWEPARSAPPAEAEAVPVVEPSAENAGEQGAEQTAEPGARPAGTRQPESFIERLRQQIQRTSFGLPPAPSNQGGLWLAALTLFVLLASGGSQIGLETAGLSAGEPLHLPLYAWLVRAYDALSGEARPLETPGHYDLLAWAQILAGMAAAWWLARGLRESFRLPAWGAPAAALLLLLPYLFGAERLGNTIGIPALAYPLFLASLCFLLQGFARGDWRRLMGFLLLLPLLLLSAEPFVFLCPAFLAVLAWVLNAYAGPRGPKLALIGLFLSALLAVFLFERLVNVAAHGRFVAVPVSGIHKVVAPLYLSEASDEGLFLGEPRLRALFHAFQSRMAARNLRRIDAVNGLVPAPELVGHYQASYSPIMRDVVLPILQQRGRQDWFEIDAVTRDIGWRLLRDKPGAWFALTLDSMVYGFGGFYPTVFLLAAFGLVGFVQVQRRDALSLALATVLLFHLTNVFMAALLGNPPRPAALYTEPAVIVLLLASLTRMLVAPEEGDDESVETVESESKE